MLGGKIPDFRLALTYKACHYKTLTHTHWQPLLALRVEVSRRFEASQGPTSYDTC